MAVLASACAAQASVEAAAPDAFVDLAGTLMAAGVLAAGCEDLEQDMAARIDATAAHYDILAREGWSIDDPRLRSEATRARVAERARQFLREAGQSLPDEAPGSCRVGLDQIRRNTALGAFLGVRQ